MNFWQKTKKLILRVLKKELRVSIRRRYFGKRDLCLLGGVYAAKLPSRHFKVALLDEDGRKIASTVANESSWNPDIPDGYGFSFPIPPDWLTPGESPILFRFKIEDTGTVFPERARQLRRPEPLKPKEIPPPSEIWLRLCALCDSVDEMITGKVVVVVTHELSRTGAPLILLELVKHLRKIHGWQMVLLSQGPADTLSEEFQKYCVLVVPDLKMGLREAPDQVRRLVDWLRPRSALPAVLLNSIVSRRLAEVCFAAGFEVKALVHEYPQGLAPASLARFLSSCSTAVFPCPDVLKETKEALEPLGGLPDTQYEIIPQGCYLLEKEPVDEKVTADFSRDFRQKHELGQGTRLVVCCGTVDSRKGFDWLIDLMRQYAKSPQAEKAPRFAWVGKVTDHSLFAKGLEDLHSAGIADYFIHVGELADVRPLLAMADVLLLCSRNDPFPSVVLESFLLGTPVIGFDRYHGCRDLILETRFGRIVPYQDIEKTIQVLDEVLADEALALRVARLGPEYIARHFNYLSYAEAIGNLLTERPELPAGSAQPVRRPQAA